jgi:3-hydroxybutyryl-CoA dehydratase
MKVGDIVSWQRTFSEDDVRLFNKISGDEGVHHVTPDEQGRLMVHGLLTATLPTKVGGDINFIAREMKFQFYRPVFAGDTVSCEVTIVELEPLDKYTNVRSEFVCRNQNGKEVMSGYALGVIRQPA